MLDIINKFDIKSTPVTYQEYGHGHVNETYLVVTDTGAKFILQKLNKSVFKDPVSLMNNIFNVTNHLKQRVKSKREVLSIVPTLTGNIYEVDENKEYWRVYDFVPDSICLEKAESLNDFYQSALAFGRFQDLLSDFPVDTLVETIPGFHDTVLRYEAFKNAVSQDVCGRAKHVQREIDFALSHEGSASVFIDLLKENKIPLRVTHNDTKLNNVLFDKKTRTGLCVVDLDTVMPGLVMNDFGDAIRFGASTASEDEKDLSKVHLDIELYAAFTKGFIEACGKNISQLEIDLLPTGAKIMTLECGVRFLTDYLSGDTYFKIHYSDQNLDRCRTQFKLVSDMERKWSEMNKIVNEEAKK
jgi:hypothetical protein